VDRERLRQRALLEGSKGREGYPNPTLRKLIAAVDKYDGSFDESTIAEFSHKFRETPNCVEIIIEAREDRVRERKRNFRVPKDCWTPEEDAIILDLWERRDEVGPSLIDEKAAEKLCQLKSNKDRNVARTRATARDRRHRLSLRLSSKEVGDIRHKRAPGG